MVIQILANLSEEGYLDKGLHPTIAPFFAGANVAFRRSAAREVGNFDPACKTGEDCDICARLAATKWELYLKRAAVMRHNNPSSIRDLMRKWYGYGRYHPYVFSKHNEPALEAHLHRASATSAERYTCLFWRRFPFSAVVFLTDFLLMHLALLFTIAAGLLGAGVAAGIGLAVTLGLLFSYVWRDVRNSGLLLGMTFTAIRYVADVSLFAGAFLGGLHEKMLYLSATVD